MAAAVVAVVFSIIQITDSQSGESTTVGIEHVSLAGLSATCCCSSRWCYLGRVAGRPRAATVAVTGQVALAALTVISNVRGEDPSFFAAVAVPANLLMFGGWVALAVALRRGGHLPRTLAVGLPLSWFLLFPGSSIGLGVSPPATTSPSGGCFSTASCRDRRSDREARLPRRPRPRCIEGPSRRQSKPGGSGRGRVAAVLDRPPHGWPDQDGGRPPPRWRSPSGRPVGLCRAK